MNDLRDDSVAAELGSGPADINAWNAMREDRDRWKREAEALRKIVEAAKILRANQYVVYDSSRPSNAPTHAWALREFDAAIAAEVRSV